jgi:hypothetical protein
LYKENKAMIIPSATHYDLPFQARGPGGLSYKTLEKSGRCLKSPKVADDVIEAENNGLKTGPSVYTSS